MRDLVAGMRYAFSGLKLITRPGIRLYVLIPLLINAVIFSLVLSYGASLLNDFINQWLTGWLEWLRWILWPLFIVISMTVIFFCFTIVANLIAAPFNGFLAEAAENVLTGLKPENDTGIKQLPAEIIRAVKSESRKFLYFILWAIPLFILFFIPVLQIAAPFLWFIFTAWMLSLEYMEFPMGNHGKLFSEIKSTLGKSRPLVIGFGIGAVILTMIPVVNFIAIPVAVCGATRLWVERIKSAPLPTD